MGGSWYKTGKEGMRESKKVDEQNRLRREQAQGPSRFWLKPDTSAIVVFLDTPEFFHNEHNMKIDGKWGNHFTCVKDFDNEGCLACDEGGSNSSYCQSGTIIDTRKWTDKDDKVHKNEKRLFVAKGRARQRLIKQIERRDGDLKWCVFEVSRGTGSNECSTGEDFEYKGRLDPTRMKKLIPSGLTKEKVKEFVTPFNYQEVFKPKSREELRKVMGLPNPVGSESDGLDDELLDGLTGSDDSVDDVLSEATADDAGAVVESEDPDDVSIDDLFKS